MRSVIRMTAATLAAVAGAWTAMLVLLGGVDTHVAGIHVTSNEPLRTLLIASVALTLYLLARPTVPWEAPMQRRWDRLVTAQPPRVATPRFRWVGVAVATACAVWLVVAGLRWNTWIAGGMDSYGYVAQADRWQRGELIVREAGADLVPWPDATATLTPLGFMPRADGTNVPYYAPGLSMLMAVARAVAGHCAAFWVAPICGGILVMATFVLGRRVHSDAVGAVAAALVAVSPTVLFMTASPMSDVPAAAFWAIAIACVARSPSTGGWRSSVVAGLCTSMALLIRPNLLPIGVVLGTWLLWRDWQDRRGLSRTIAYAAGSVPGCLLVAYFNWAWYGSPFETGPGSLGYLFQAGNITANLRRYPQWFVDTQTWVAGLAVVAIFAPVRAIWRSRETAQIIGLFAALVLATLSVHLLFVPLDEWWFLRYLLAAWPPIFVAVALLLSRLWERRVVLARGFAALVVIWLGADGLRTAHARGAFELGRGEVRYVDLATLVQAHTPPETAILSMQHSGTLRDYAGRATIRWDALPGDWLDRAVEWLAANGTAPFIVLEAWEMPEFRRRFASQRLVTVLDAPPLVAYTSPHSPAVYVFDPRRRDAVQTLHVRGGDPPARCLPFVTAAPKWLRR